jgi:hypothetical protein
MSENAWDELVRSIPDIDPIRQSLWIIETPPHFRSLFACRGWRVGDTLRWFRDGGKVGYGESESLEIVCVIVQISDRSVVVLERHRFNGGDWSKEYESNRLDFRGFEIVGT